MKKIQRAVCNLRYLQWLFAIAFVFLGIGWPRAVAQKESAPQPLWEIDLSKFDYQSKPQESQEGHRWWGDRQSLFFTQENVVATTFEVHIENSGPSVRDKNLPTDPYHMRALFLDARKGTVVTKGDWPIKSSDRTWFFPAQNGQFIVGINDKLSLYAPDISFITERVLHASWGQILNAMPSPAADTFFVQYTGSPELKYARQLELLDTAHLVTLKSWTEDQKPGAWIVWGTELARFSEHDLQIMTPQSEPEHIAASKEMYCGYSSFISQGTLLVGKLDKTGCNANVNVISRDGTVVNELHFDPKGLVDPAVASRNGMVFAIPSYVTQKAPATPTISVFRLGSPTPILTVNVVPPQSRMSISMGGRMDFLGWWWNAEWGAIALSPEGDLLAVRAGPFVRVYRVPGVPQ